MCAILQLVSAPLNPRLIADHFRKSHPYMVSEQMLTAGYTMQHSTHAQDCTQWVNCTVWLPLKLFVQHCAQYFRSRIKFYSCSIARNNFIKFHRAPTLQYCVKCHDVNCHSYSGFSQSHFNCQIGYVRARVNKQNDGPGSHGSEPGQLCYFLVT